MAPGGGVDAAASEGAGRPTGPAGEAGRLGRGGAADVDRCAPGERQLRGPVRLARTCRQAGRRTDGRTVWIVVIQGSGISKAQ
jgi:hypothetical protein